MIVKKSLRNKEIFYDESLELFKRSYIDPSKRCEYELIDFIFGRFTNKNRLTDIRASSVGKKSKNIYEVISLVKKPKYSIKDIESNLEYFKSKIITEPIDILKLFVHNGIDFKELTWDDYYMTVPYKGYNIRKDDIQSNNCKSNKRIDIESTIIDYRKTGQEDYGIKHLFDGCKLFLNVNLSAGLE